MSAESHVEVLEPVRRYFTALNAGDRDGVLAVFTRDASVMPPAHPTIGGPAAIGEFYGHRFSAVVFGRELQVDEVVVSGDVAAVRCRTTGTVTVRASGETKPADSRELFVLHRDGADWRIRHYMFNSPTA